MIDLVSYKKRKEYQSVHFLYAHMGKVPENTVTK